LHAALSSTLFLVVAGLVVFLVVFELLLLASAAGEGEGEGADMNDSTGQLSVDDGSVVFQAYE
tara:strand:+ start:178 stop:366 length:189 start_codon:yes stop_codon:yes gene_type:complete